MSSPRGTLLADGDRGLSWWARLGCVAGVGLVIRLAFVFGVARYDQPVGDQLYYSAQAFNNAAGRWFEQPFAAGMPAADHPPLTALLLTPATWLVRSTDSFITVQRLVMVVVGVAGIVVMGSIGRLLGGDRTGLVAAAITAVYANVWVNDGLIMAESPTFLLVASTVLVVLHHHRGGATVPWWRLPVVVGVLVGLLALTRAELVLCAPLIALYLVRVHRGDVRAGARSLGVFAVSALVVVSPWIGWNRVRFDESVFLSTNDGLTLAGANCDRTYYYDIGSWDIWCAYETDVPDGVDASVESRLMRSSGLGYWREHLSRYPAVAASRVLRVTSLGFIGSNTDAGEAEGRPTWVSLLGVVQFWMIAIAAVVGFRRMTDRVDRAVLVALVPVVVVVAMVANAYVRFRLPAEVGLIVLAATALSARRPSSV